MERFNLNARKKSFLFAFRGLFHTFKTQHNLWIHFSIAVLVIVAAIILNLNSFQWCLLVFAIGFVIVAEFFNTALEKLVDLISPEFNPKAGMVKDIAAGAVLVSAITAAIIGLLVFIPELMKLIH